MRKNRYWDVPRLAGETEAAHAKRLGRIYFTEQTRENSEWWRRIGVPVDLAGKRVIEVGCGYGALCIDAAARGAAQVVGVDLDTARVGFAREHLLEEHAEHARSVSFFETSLELLPEGEPFDVVLSKDTFEHVEDLRTLIDGLAQRLRPGGVLVFGFSPLYFSPNGDHGRYALPLPWMHVLLPDALIFRWASYWTGHQVRSAADVGLNRLTRPEFEAMLPSSRWERVQFRINPMSSPLRFPLNLLRRIPGLERYFTVGLYGVYRKRG